jgi:aminodeoxyfutalosine deaminase
VVTPDWLVTMPKVELHVHLEGTISPATLWELVQRNQADIGIKSLDDAESLFFYTDFTHFIDTFTRCSMSMRTADDLGLLVRAYGAELARQGARYAEVHFNPEPHRRWRSLSIQEQLSAMNAARADVLDKHGVELRWIADGVRDAVPGPISASHTVDMMLEAGPDSGIVALGLGGNELMTAPALFIDAFRRARDAGFHVVAHAGEARGPESVRGAVEYLGAERIGHGIRSVEDPQLLEMLRDHEIPLEVCPTSNVCTGVVQSLQGHPLRDIAEAGVAFSISSDDPPMFGTNLTSELAIASQLLGLDRHGMAHLMASTISQSFAPDELKCRLLADLIEHTSLDVIPG